MRRSLAHLKLDHLLLYFILFLLWVVMIWLATHSLTINEWNFSLTWLNDWKRWDAEWYERIWSDGYTRDRRALAFPPGFPWLAGSFSLLTSIPFHRASTLVNLAAYFAAGVIATETLNERFKLSRASIFTFFLASPTGYFAFAPYSDAVFMTLFWIAIRLGLQRPSHLSWKEKILAGMTFFIMPWMRITSYSLISWVLLRRWYTLSLLVSFGCWMGLNATIAEDPLYFLDAQKVFAMPEGNLIDGLRSATSNFIPSKESLQEPTPWLQFHFLPLILLGLILATAVWLAFKREWLLALTLISVAAFSHNQAFWRSVLRYDLPLWVFLTLPLLTPSGDTPSQSHSQNSRRDTLSALLHVPSGRRIVMASYWFLVLAGFLLQVYFARLFRSGLWAF